MPTAETHTVRIEHNCPACNGTGLYVGVYERDGAAVVCHECDGTGKGLTTFTYKEFRGRKKPPATIRHVVQTSVGICIKEGKDHEFVLSDFGGLPIQEWLALERPDRFPPHSEMRRFVCPAWWYQSVDYKKQPQWKQCLDCECFSSCSHFTSKCLCWERWDKEFGTKETEHAAVAQ